jgi:hypothetical protein
MIGTIIGLAFPIVRANFNDPPPSSTVISLMDQEVEAGKSHNLAIVDRIYGPGATVTDAACRTAGASQTWQGTTQIEGRYSALPAFAALYHVNIHITWQPADNRANRAEVTADTVGVLGATATSPVGQAFYGHEMWVFAKSGDQWVVRSFIYNLCLP